ncbi:hypothetical protein ASB62_02805 [Chlorobium limicola]|uniref:Uncharacterized protein n=1 Tax=Chlorobium limicola TaxID=1092 RepID=A0A101JR84_CHLLI|nr:hypothetical protein ASB62_02805 [Chlorobium limicola]
MHRYLGGLMDPFISLLEVHKLLYFMQCAGQNLRLVFTKGPYGPYAENLRHLLHALEGHMLSGYDDGGRQPDTEITQPKRLADILLANLAGRLRIIARIHIGRIVPVIIPIGNNRHRTGKKPSGFSHQAPLPVNRSLQTR